MLIFRILATIFIAISLITGILKSICFFEDTSQLPQDKKYKAYIIIFIYSILWRALVIVALWL